MLKLATSLLLVVSVSLLAQEKPKTSTLFGAPAKNLKFLKQDDVPDNFAADDKPEKRVARAMIHFAAEVNPKVPGPDENVPGRTDQLRDRDQNVCDVLHMPSWQFMPMIGPFTYLERNSE